MKTKIFKNLIIFLSTLLNISIVKAAELPSISDLNPGSTRTLTDYINIGIKFIITVSQISFIVLFLIGGVMYLTSAGNEESASKARKLMLNAVIGLVIVFAAYPAATYILEQFK